MIEHNDYIYVALSGSNCLVKLNEACVEQEAAYFASDEELSAGIRYLAAKGGYIYASFYGGVVAKINANTLKVEKKLKIKNGYNLEGIAVCGDNLYVANSYKIDVEGNFIYLEDVFVVELSSFEQKETLKVASNPNLMLEEEGKIFLISRGNYSDVLEQLQMIEPGNGNKITNLGAVASYMTAEDGVLYLAKSVADWSGYPNVAYVNTYSTYDVRTGKLEALPLVESADEVGKCSLGMIAVEDGDIYIGSPEDYRNNGTVYRIKKNGGLVEKFDCGG